MSVTAAKGFLAAGVPAGIKASGRSDFALVVNSGPDAHAAGVFTSNRFTAAPVKWSQQVIADGRLAAVALNSGGANACTGDAGYADTVQTAEWVAAEVGCDVNDVAVCSTGLIGVRLPMDAVLNGVQLAAQDLSHAGGPAAAEAIMTTDTVAKEAIHTSPSGWTIGGMAKGAGMLAPALATMLVVVTTDAKLTPSELDAALKVATGFTFDRTDSDGCMSTNDTVLLLASGASQIVPDTAEFGEALTGVCANLAKQLLADAEGSAHDIEVRVVGAATEADALAVARAIARSNLFKCAIFGNDPNWGRVLAAAGTVSAGYDPEHVDVSFNGVGVFLDGQLGADRSEVDLTKRAVLVELNLHAGEAAAAIWTNDLTYDYVKENAEYSS
ncbi:bifunctional glutamate N-acetyltransferase/amino-acid acetyltransferase ArgJ [Propionicimonas sp.]|uniref:bifunctional glutamate N-acetyltransferase/amino-acid acetyltransferase ArgJ n=1 Tax=Propionicimonas sp. TaxID=1955623 RepID=UPI00185B6702|nr:bifunctional glutamate N-acetyltransferase/amino-acid acetyltransferase ArgJ [Propionicimonas sp.]MBU3976268.1 bifunctional glutamate N-acetyltransferase/amino-acid acetyltransferase ArgJ [Actinomycetota bacterium]MBA3021080.1 bifunctional glutamate N-acetyltransferase/amino-acid acetyltransferase ArgJ [Propionicimonas sp.]MBU3985663.1 bifunctional glutamate N-acetyltransferase/amino-acid acetyltransferase ArgJ [Actinomycetota bacterium]MBU4008448.1 bifunctional glutamate N-acetyltransferase